MAATDPQTGYAPVGELDMYYEIHGRGRPLILLHGAYMTVDMMAPLVARLAEARQVIAPEQQGHGRTADVDRVVEDSLSDAHFVAMFPALARARLALREQAWQQAQRAASRAVALPSQSRDPLPNVLRDSRQRPFPPQRADQAVDLPAALGRGVRQPGLEPERVAHLARVHPARQTCSDARRRSKSGCANRCQELGHFELEALAVVREHPGGG